MIEVEEARARIIGALVPPRPEPVPLDVAGGRFLATDAHSRVALPGFDNSAMDGYAVLSGDVAAASADRPVTLRCSGTVPAGTASAEPVLPGTCVRIFTGSPMPPGADAVVMQEDTSASGDQVAVLDAVKPWENVRLRGEDVAPGALVAPAGTRLTAPVLAVLGAAGLAEVTVGRHPVVGLLATGDELREPGTPLAPGQIHESNRLMLSAMITAAGGRSRPYPLVPDSLEGTRDALRRAFEACDIVVTTGGASVGDHDYVKAALQALGGTVDFWKVSMKPGKPFILGRLGDRLLFGLPGNPVSAFVTGLLLLRPALLYWQRAADIDLPRRPGVLAEPLRNRGPRPHYMRVCQDATGAVRSTGPQASHMLSSLAPANALLRVPADSELPAGTVVTVLSFD